MSDRRDARDGSETEGGIDVFDRRTVVKSGGVLAGGMGLAGCLGGGNGGGGGGNSGGGGGGGGGSAVNIAIVSSPAGFGDKAFNDLAWKGLQEAKEEFDNIKLQKVEETNQANYKTVQSRLAERGYDLVVLVGYNHTQALQTNATQYPDQKWMLINDYVDQPNVAGYIWANHQMSYQAGVLAGTMTTRQFSYKGSSTTPQKPIVGFVGGVDGALINAFERAYKAGATWVNKDVEVRVGYIGNYNDVQKANDIASSHYDAGADIVYHAAAAAGQGVFQAAQSADRFAIGVDADQSVTLPQYKDVIMASAIKRINKGTYDVTKAIVNDNWQQVNGKNVLGLEEKAVALELGQAIGPKLPQVAKDNLLDSKNAIINGEISVPCSASGCK